MKKHLSILTLAMVSLLVASCNGNGGNTSSTTVSSTPNTSSSSTSSSSTQTVNVAISGPTSIRYGGTINLLATVTGSANTAVIWSTDSNVVAVSDGTVIVIKEVTVDTTVTITATSVADNTKSASYTITVLAPEAQPELTDEMLSLLKDEKIDFAGENHIDIYGITSTSLVGTSDMSVHTYMEHNRWVADYTGDTNSGRIYYANKDGYANKVQISLMNSEEYVALEDDYGLPITWENSGLYNPFINIKVSDFTFNRDTWMYEYTGSDTNFLTRATSALTPYDFEPKTLSLVISDDEIIAIQLKSDYDYRIVSGYRVIQTLTSSFNSGDLVNIPSLPTYSYEEDAHGLLKNALEKMHSLSSYKTRLTMQAYDYSTGSQSITGYEETVTPTEMFYKPFTAKVSQGALDYTYTSPFGYRQIDENTYNYYTPNKDGSFEAFRSYKGNVTDKAPSFEFDAAIFNPGYAWNSKEKEATYSVYEGMCYVASTLYQGFGSDYPLYGLYSTKGSVNGNTNYVPQVTVSNDGYITYATFYFNMGIMYGIVELEFYDFDTTTLPEEATSIQFTPKVVPTSWADVDFYYSAENLGTNDSTLPGDQALTNVLGAEVLDVLPFFDNVLGDTFGLALNTLYNVPGTGVYTPCYQIYYDVAVDADYSLNKSLAKVKQELIDEGFVRNSYGGYDKDGYTVLPVDSSLDLYIYVFKTPSNIK